MSDGKSASRGRFPRLRVLKRLWAGLLRTVSGHRMVPADELDDWLKRDIGVHAASPPDRLTTHYRNINRSGQPLP